MARSKDIADYREVSIEDLQVNHPLPCDVHLYLSNNRHILLWKPRGEILTPLLIEKCRNSRIQKLWIHKEDLDALVRKPVTPAAPSPSQSPSLSPPLSPAEIRKREGHTVGREIVVAIASQSLSPEQKVEQVSRIAQKSLITATSAQTAEAQNEFNIAARETVRVLLESTRSETSAQVRNIWAMEKFVPELGHGLNVSTWAVLFCMGFGKVDRMLLADVAMAGLLHDLGVSTLPVAVAQTTWKNLSADQKVAYATHVQAGVDLITKLAPSLSSRAKRMVLQHHEKFDGSGYPNGSDGFKIDDTSQLVAMADVLESICSGQWDGTPRSLAEAFHLLEQLEKSRTFPEHFNPEVFGKVIRWIQVPNASEALSDASSTAGTQAKQILKQKKLTP